MRVPSLLLAAALQVLPIVRVALPAAQTATNVLAIIFRWSVGAAAALGGVNAVSGASTLINSPLNVKGTNGVPFSLRLSTAPNAAHYWEATGLPSGLALTGTSGSTLWTIAGTPTVTGVYNVGLKAKGQVTDGASRTVTNVLTITLVAGAAPPTPPSITTQPVSVTTTQGLSATFSVTATGTAPLSYQWRFNNANLSGKTASSLTFNPVSTANAGNYSVVVSNSGGSVTSSVVSLTVVVPVTPPSITSQPTSLVTTQGLSASFSVGASGTAPLSYQWRFNNANLSGKTTSSLTLNPVSTANAGNYDVIVSNSGGSVTSSVVSLTVVVPVTPPSITSQPTSLVTTQGLSASFSVGASGTAPLSYQWRFNNANLSGQTASSLTLNPVSTANAGNYSVVVSNSGG
ncbi:MAG TPA: immunoglobulin domain-containing protein, partial [Candidatus Paceibacterota bacterium]|nr:immunoglobulin domain-containing protein [Candidatus Paceibacterota bacterium]